MNAGPRCVALDRDGGEEGGSEREAGSEASSREWGLVGEEGKWVAGA